MYGNGPRRHKTSIEDVGDPMIGDGTQATCADNFGFAGATMGVGSGRAAEGMSRLRLGGDRYQSRGRIGLRVSGCVESGKNASDVWIA